jgi:ankyrin repeat protein
MKGRIPVARLPWGVVLALLVAACATTAPSAPETGAKTFSTSPDLANIYIYAWTMGKGVPVAVDGEFVGVMAEGGSFVLASVPPGTHKLDAASGSLTLTAAAGRNYFVQIYVSGFGNIVTQVSLDVDRDVEQAQERIRRSRMVGSITQPSRPLPPPLILAAQGGDAKAVRQLLDSGVPVDVRDVESGATALMAAAGVGKLDVVSLLLERGADPNARTLAGFSALMFASGFGHLPVATLLIEKGADVNAKNGLGNSSLQIAAGKSSDLNTVALLLDRGANIDAQARDGWTALMDAIDLNQVAIAKALIQRGANVNLAANSGWTALMAAALKGHADVAGIAQ